ncbi:hypothetical protein [Mycoplasma sp. CSL7503-lung]|uniref:hypothetical protein n=1 Tax=Mycoplasma sp. CSL7503-lung TaxID=536372 RepID=UPI0021D16079|nr:hypothetical protein [Mycoplasma sp. CSL7503-lung]MCU4706472.1 hypothetical protein [Mycoplasma sp. CSL7503-lung]
MKKIFLKKYYPILTTSIIPIFIASISCSNNNYEKNKIDNKSEDVNTNNKKNTSNHKIEKCLLDKGTNNETQIEQKQNKRISAFKKYLNLNNEQRKVYDDFFFGMFTLPWETIEKIDNKILDIENNNKKQSEEVTKEQIDTEPLKYGIITLLKTNSSVILNIRLDEDSTKYDFWTFPTKEGLSHKIQKSSKKSSKTPNNTIWVTFDLNDYLNRNDSENLTFIFYYNINNGEYKKLELDKKIMIKNKKIVIE